MFELVQLIVFFRVTKLWILSLKPAHTLCRRYSKISKFNTHWTLHSIWIIYWVFSHTEIKRQGDFQGIPFLILLARFPNLLNMFPFVHCSSLTKWLLQQVWPVSAPSTSSFTSLKWFPCGQGKARAVQAVLSPIYSLITHHTQTKSSCYPQNAVSPQAERNTLWKNPISKKLQNFHRKKSIKTHLNGF